MGKETVIAEGFFSVYVGMTKILQAQIAKIPMGTGGEVTPVIELLKPINHKAGKLVFVEDTEETGRCLKALA